MAVIVRRYISLDVLMLLLQVLLDDISSAHIKWRLGMLQDSWSLFTFYQLKKLKVFSNWVDQLVDWVKLFNIWRILFASEASVHFWCSSEVCDSRFMLLQAQKAFASQIVCLDVLWAVV
jgi:hypothetical protein